MNYFNDVLWKAAVLSLALVPTVSLRLAAQEPPQLRIQALGAASARIEWPAGIGSWRLEENVALDSPADWREATVTPVQVGQVFRVDIDVIDETRFFRLRKANLAPPVLNPIGVQTVALGTTLRLQFAATDADGDTLSFFALPLPLLPNATLDVSTGTFSFRPDLTQVGALALQFGVTDGEFSDTETVSIVVPPPVGGGVTAISGLVLDTTSAVAGQTVPVQGVVVSLLGQTNSAVSGADGRFLLTGIRGGARVLDLNVSAARPAPDGAPYAGFREEIKLIEGVVNEVTRPFYLPRLSVGSLVTVNPLQITTVSNAALGATLVVSPTTAKLDGTNFTGQLSISPVPEALAPAALPEDLGFGNLITIQPVGVIFQAPARLTMPNSDNMPPGSELDLWSLDAGTGQFVVVGKGRVTANGQFIETIEGGVRAADWHGFLAPRPGATADNQTSQHTDKDPCAGGASMIFLSDGALTTDFSLPAMFSLSEPHTLRWIYNSARAHPYVLTPYQATVLKRAATPPYISGEVTVPGFSANVGFFDTRGFRDATDETLRGSAVVDAASLPTGVYPYEVRITSHYGNSRISSRTPGEFIVVNEQASPFGAGWGLAGLQRLHVQKDGSVLLADGDGSAHLFEAPSPGWVQSNSFPLFSETAFGPTSATTMLADGRVAVLRVERLFFVNRSGGIDKDITLNFPPNAIGTAHGLAALTDGGIVVTGVENFGGIVFRIFNADGSERTAKPVGVSPANSFDGGLQGASTPQALPDGNFIIVWNSALNFTNGALGTHPTFGTLQDTTTAVDVRGRYYDATGAPLSTAFSATGDAFIITEGEVSYDGAVINSRYGNQYLNDLDFLPDSTLLLTYRGTRWQGTSRLWNPYNYALFKGVQRAGFTFNETAFRQGSTEFERRSDMGAQTAVLTDGRLACFYDQPGNPLPLKMRFFQTNGIPVDNGVAGGREFDLGISIPNLSTRYFSPHAAPDGGFILIYSQQDSGFVADMYLRRYDRDAQLLETIPVSIGPGDDALGSAVPGRRGEWFITTYKASTQSIQVLRYFENPGGRDAFVSPRGDSSIFRPAAGGGFTRTFLNGSRDEFDTNGLHTAAINASGNLTRFEYDGSGRLTRVTDPVGRASAFTYAGSRLAQVTDATGRATAFIYDAAGNLIRATFPDATSRQFGYDARHLMTSETDALGQLKTRTFDKYGIFQSAKLPDGSTFSVRPSGLAGVNGGTAASPAAVTRAADAFAIIEDGAGRQRRVQTGKPGESFVRIEPSGEITQTTRDQDGNVSRITYASGHRISAVYDEKGNLTTFQDHGLESFYRYSYSEDLSRLTAIVDSFGDTTRFTHDGRGNLISVTSPLGRQARLSFAANGLLQTATNSLGTANAFGYDALGNQTSFTEGSGAAQRMTTASYTPEGYLARITNSLGETAALEYDTVGHVTRQTLSSGHVSEFAYDAEGRLVSLTPPGRPAHQLAYQPQGFLSNYTAPKVGVENSTTSYSYNLAQQLTAVNRPDGKRITLEYDSGGRPARTILGRGANQFSYQPTNGHLATLMSTDGINTIFGYTGELLTETRWQGVVTGKVNLAYDRNARISSVAVNGAAIAHSYDADGALIQSGLLTLSYGSTDGLLTGTELGQVRTAWAYNEFAEPTRATTTVAGAPFFTTDYQRDKLGRITRKAEIVPGITNIFDYTYDDAGQLVQVVKNGMETTTYTYDLNGNRLTRAGTSATESGAYDAQDRIITYAGASYAYTAAGELATRTETGLTTRYTYDELGNLLAVIKLDGTRIDYVIDATIQRMAKKVNGVVTRKFLWQGPLRLAAELDAADQVVTRMVYGTRPNVPEYIIKSGVAYRLVTDHLGSVRFVINSADGSIAQALDYDEFGRVLQDTAPGFQPFGFAGGLYDPGTGLVRFGARDYDARSGRWTAKDPTLFAGGQLCLYNYASNDPANLVDFEGTDPVPPFRPPTEVINTINGALNNVINLERGELWEVRKWDKLIEGVVIWEEGIFREEAKEIPPETCPIRTVPAINPNPPNAGPSPAPTPPPPNPPAPSPAANP